VNAATFLEQFAHLAEAPNGIPKLRELILQLAVRGKLVPQDPNDEPAAELLKRIQAEKHRLIAEGTIRKSKPLPSAHPASELLELPSHWSWTRLGFIGLTQTGTTPKTSNPHFFGEGYPFIKPADISSSGEVRFNGERLTEEGIQNGRRIASGSALMVCIGGSIGKVGYTDRECSCNQQINALTPLGGVDGRFLAYLMRSPRLQEQVLSTAPKTTIPILSKGKWEQLLIPMPPLSEQKRIVAKVDELMALCDELEVKQQAERTKQIALNRASLNALTEANGTSLAPAWHRVRNHFDHLYTRPETVAELRQTILQLAVMGRLVPQDTNDEPASELLKKIHTEKARLIAEGIIRKPKKHPPIESDNVPYDLPGSWLWSQLGQLIADLRYGTAVKCSYGGHGSPVLRIPNVVQGKVDVEDLKYARLSEKDLASLALHRSDILSIRSNGSVSIVGRMAQVDTDMPGYAFAGYLIRLRPLLDPSSFILVASNSSLVREQIEGPIRTTSGVKNVNSKELESLLVPLPPLAEQKRIVAKVDQLMTLCDDLEAKLQQSQTDADNLVTAIVHELVGSQGGEQG
jgi:type I restriction enzyme, S subunit